MELEYQHYQLHHADIMRLAVICRGCFCFYENSIHGRSVAVIK